MTAGLRALLTGVLDYAGLFPPAKLPLDEAIRDYARYRSGPHAWVLTRFVVPASRLDEVSAWAAVCPFVYAALGRGGDGPGEFTAGLTADLGAVDGFRRHPEDPVRVDSVRGPPTGSPPRRRIPPVRRATGRHSSPRRPTSAPPA